MRFSRNARQSPILSRSSQYPNTPQVEYLPTNSISPWPCYPSSKGGSRCLYERRKYQNHFTNPFDDATQVDRHISDSLNDVKALLLLARPSLHHLHPSTPTANSTSHMCSITSFHLAAGTVAVARYAVFNPGLLLWKVLMACACIYASAFVRP
ncbi:hypothetical protein CPC08DRAFT_394472 [Agrocybe pediades]|nr:hypothetical protein CPC08DRAFT_394472 [Agrocybe pediades]